MLTLTILELNYRLTQVHDIVAGSVEGAGVKLETDDGKDDDGEEEEEGDVDEGADGLGNG